MTSQERTEYSARMRAAKTEQERTRIRAEHHEQMQVRAKDRGVTLPAEPPARGKGAGPGSGAGEAALEAARAPVAGLAEGSFSVINSHA